MVKYNGNENVGEKYVMETEERNGKLESSVTRRMLESETIKGVNKQHEKEL
jgi:hypothetical protein